MRYCLEVSPAALPMAEALLRLVPVGIRLESVDGEQRIHFEAALHDARLTEALAGLRSVHPASRLWIEEADQ